MESKAILSHVSAQDQRSANIASASTVAAASHYFQVIAFGRKDIHPHPAAASPQNSPPLGNRGAEILSPTKSWRDVFQDALDDMGVICDAKLARHSQE
jgi:hypothetical protein